MTLAIQLFLCGGAPCPALYAQFEALSIFEFGLVLFDPGCPLLLTLASISDAFSPKSGPSLNLPL